MRIIARGGAIAAMNPPYCALINSPLKLPLRNRSCQAARVSFSLFSLLLSLNPLHNSGVLPHHQPRSFNQRCPPCELRPRTLRRKGTRAEAGAGGYRGGKRDGV